MTCQLSLDEEQVEILTEGMVQLGRDMLEQEWFHQLFVQVYTGLFGEDGQKHLSETNAVLPGEINVVQFFSLLFHLTILLLGQEEGFLPKEEE